MKDKNYTDEEALEIIRDGLEAEAFLEKCLKEHKDERGL